MPAAGERVELRRSWMENREALAAVSAVDGLEREAPAMMRMALLTKRAKVKREMASSAIEYERQDLMALKVG